MRGKRLAESGTGRIWDHVSSLLSHQAEMQQTSMQCVFECCSTPLEQSAACHACNRLPRFFQEATEEISV